MWTHGLAGKSATKSWTQAEVCQQTLLSASVFPLPVLQPHLLTVAVQFWQFSEQDFGNETAILTTFFVVKERASLEAQRMDKIQRLNEL